MNIDRIQLPQNDNYGMTLGNGETEVEEIKSAGQSSSFQTTFFRTYEHKYQFLLLLLLY